MPEAIGVHDLAKGAAIGKRDVREEMANAVAVSLARIKVDDPTAWAVKTLVSVVRRFTSETLNRLAWVDPRACRCQSSECSVLPSSSCTSNCVTIDDPHDGFHLWTGLNAGS